ncbi:hypothetical protein DK419_13380 [Methylobacterium terrae]|uniref:DUF2188 domain-containing protein n=1 Tax=Methylobacterium terrae TaxID=2202827 RepID=A0A2U8WPG6_9HYPH|nr:hypothetical protein [Methylobacterium terrae]AWN47186.1 hypothetical protein DK419_13380 [Methylobacterium terrae]
MDRFTPKPDEAKRPRPKAAVGGGFVVMRRGDSSNRLFGHPRPYEHPSLEVAQAEAARLAAKHNRDFCVFQQVAVAPAPAVPASSTDEVA